MRAVEVVVLQPGQEMLIAFLRVEVMAHVGSGLVSTISFSGLERMDYSLLGAGGPLKPGFGLSGDVQISSGDFSFLSDRFILSPH
jgi:hypothetical protein